MFLGRMLNMILTENILISKVSKKGVAYFHSYFKYLRQDILIDVLCTFSSKLTIDKKKKKKKKKKKI